MHAERSNRIVSNQPLDSLVLDIAKILAIPTNDLEDIKEIQKRCFDKAIELCQKKEWKIFELNKDALSKITDVFGRSLLIYSVDENQETWVEKFVRYKIGRLTTDKEGNNALHHAAKNGAVHLFHFLDFLNINAFNTATETPLHVAIKAGKNKVVAKLIEQNADLNLTTPLKNIHLSSSALAVACGQINCLDTLIQKGKCLIDEKVEGIGNLLHLAVHFGQIKMLRHLLDNYPEMKVLFEEANEKKDTPLVYAAKLDDVKAIRLLVNKGASLDKIDAQGKAPIHHAAYNRKYEAVQAFIHLGAKLNKADKSGNTPLAIVEKENNDDAITTAHLLKNVLSGESNRFSLLPASCPVFPKNFAFKGGGVKGTAYAGIVKAFEERNLLGFVEKISGSSAGAIVSALIAFQYTATEIEEISFKKNFTDFLDHPLATKNIKEALNDKFSSVGQTLSTLMEIYDTAVSTAANPTKIFQSLWRTTGICKGEELRKYVEQLIAKKVHEVTGKDIEYLTYGEHNELIQQGYPFKHLHIYVTKLGDTPEIVSFNSESPECKDIIISDTIRGSASLPGVFEPHFIYIKRQGQRLKLDQAGSFVDGGVLYNLPLEAFDQKKNKQGTFFKFNKYTMGFNLVSSGSDKNHEEKNVETVGDLLLGLTSTYFRAEELIRRLNPANAKRIIDIDVGDVQTANFGLSDEKKQNLVDSGYQATQKFLETLPSTVSFHGLILKYPLNYQDLYMHFCTVLEKENEFVTESLLSLGIDIDQLMDSNNNTVAHYFSERGNNKALEFIDSQGASLDKKNKQGLSPFHIAVLKGKISAMDWLYAKHPKCLEQKSEDNNNVSLDMTLMKIAIQGGHVEVMEWLNAKNPSFFDPSHLFIAIEAKKILAITWILKQLDIQELDLGNKELGDEKIEIFVQALEKYQSLQKLDLKGNNLSKKVGIALGKLLENDKCLISLILDKNNFDDESGVAIGKGLKNHPNLRYLNLLGNHIGDKGGVEIVQSIPSQLKILILSSNELTDVTIQEFVSVLKGNKTLEKLSLWGNKITYNGAKLLLETLISNPAFKELYLQQNNITDSEIADLKKIQIQFKLSI